MEMNIRIGINHKSRLSPTVHNSLQIFLEFKVDFHHIYLRPCKDPAKKWSKLPFITTNDVIFNVLEMWSLEWHAPEISALEMSITQKKKEKKKLLVAQLAKKRQKEVVAAKAHETWDAAQEVTK